MNDARRTLPKVLIVDDSRMVRAIIIKHIRGSFDVREEVDGEAGWEALLLDPAIQVVITDQSMPKLDGYGLIERMRTSRIARIREMPAIMISGDEDEAARQRAKDLGASDFITKGIGTAELVSRLDVLVKLSRTSVQLEEARGQTVVDEASGLLSKAFLVRQAEQAIAHAQRHDGDVSLLAISFDQFDLLRKEMGAALGEHLLQHFAALLTRSIRRSDSLARWEPCTFAVLLINAPLAAANGFALRLSKAIETAAIQWQGRALHLTLSIGVANSRADAVDGVEAMVALAEERMDRACGEGGNRVVAGGDETLLPARSGEETARLSIDEALARIGAGQGETLSAVLPHLGQRLLPLLRLLDAAHELQLPLESMERKLAKAIAGSASENNNEWPLPE